MNCKLSRPKESGFGCYVNQQYVGACGYADDVILRSPTIFGTQGMLKICENYAKEYNVHFNASKSKLIVQKKCGSREAPDPPHLLFMGGSMITLSMIALGEFCGGGSVRRRHVRSHLRFQSTCYHVEILVQETSFKYLVFSFQDKLYAALW